MHRMDLSGCWGAWNRDKIYLYSRIKYSTLLT